MWHLCTSKEDNKSFKSDLQSSFKKSHLILTCFSSDAENVWSGAKMQSKTENKTDKLKETGAAEEDIP